MSTEQVPDAGRSELPQSHAKLHNLHRHADFKLDRRLLGGTRREVRSESPRLATETDCCDALCAGLLGNLSCVRLASAAA